MGRTFINTITILFAVIFAACREEIIQPNNISGNVNEPTQIKEFNSYTFIINAEDADFTLIESTFFTAEKVNLVITNLDYNKGAVKLNILNENGISYFEYLINEELDSQLISVEGAIPSSIEIQLIGFTGKLKVQLSPF